MHTHHQRISQVRRWDTELLLHFDLSHKLQLPVIIEFALNLRQFCKQLLQHLLAYRFFVETPLEKYYPPDTTAAIFWLKNRQKDKWRDKVDHELTGKDGGAIQIETSPMSTLFGK
jgi:hypothetical protein